MAFYDNQLTSVIIPGSVISVGEGAFAKNKLATVVIPPGVTVIEAATFAYNQLANVVIPDSVTSIGWGAFGYNQITNITIPAGITPLEGWEDLIPRANPRAAAVDVKTIVFRAFDAGFDDFYRENGSKEGTYIYSDGHWRYKQ